MNLPKKKLEKETVYEFIFDQHKAPLSKKISEYQEKRLLWMQFELKSHELIDIQSEATNDNSEE